MRFRPLVALATLLLIPCVSQGQVLSLLHRSLTAPVHVTPAPLPDAGQDETKRWEAATEFSYETLSNGYAPWYSAQLTLSRKFATGQMTYGSYRETARFSRHDREATAGLRQPLGKKWAVQAEAGLSPTHQVLSKWTVLTQVERQLGRGWVAQAGFRYSAYNTVQAKLGIASIERYWSRYRAAYTLYTGAAGNSGVSVTHRVSGNYFYGAQNSLGVGLAVGGELAHLGTLGILRTKVRNVAVNGRHWFNSRWALSYGIAWHEQGDFYVRRGVTFGLSRQF